MRKVIVFVLTVFVFMSPVFSGTGRNVGQELLLNNDGTSISLSFEKYKMKDGWTPVVLSLGELDYLLWMDEDGRVSEQGEIGTQFVKPVCVIDIPTHCLRKDGATLYFDVYEQNSIRTRWRLSPGRTMGPVAKSQTCAAMSAKTASSAIPDLERAALIALYNSTNGDNWSNKNGWKTPPLAADGFALPGTENTWYGITCDPGNTTVQMINPQSNSLNGTLPPQLGNLANLQYLALESNRLSGSIPPELGNLANLQYLSLESNRLSGSIPPELGNLANLKHLNLSKNQFSGSIPPELGNLANLQYLNLGLNQFNGSIPPQLGTMANLQEFFLSSNQISGSIPPQLGTLVNLQKFSLSSNQLSGSIPPELGNLANLTSLDLRTNQLSGSIPKELGNLANLQVLNLYWNQLSGSIPPELGNLANLQSLDLGRNQLSGSIPPVLGNLTNLHDLTLWLNQLSGHIPSELGNLANLKGLYLSSNELSGCIPLQLGTLANLKTLWLYSNQLSGCIPTELGNLANLRSLILHSNRLRGSIPPELGNLANLEVLVLHSNQLTGAITSNLTNLTWLFSLDLRWNALYTNDDMLRAFLNSVQDGGDWESTQTIAPTDVTATVLSPSSVCINWTPIAYTADTGGYRVYYRTSYGRRYFYFGMTEDKTASSLIVTGLKPGTNYYFVVKTMTNRHEYNQNRVLSGYSAEVSVLTPYPLTLTSPNGGESWSLRTVQNITWSFLELTGRIRIELWKANRRFCVIAHNISIANGNYAWTVGNHSVIAIPAGNDYKVKIITEKGMYHDASDGSFSIVK